MLNYKDSHKDKDHSQVLILIHGNRSSLLFWDHLIEKVHQLDDTIRCISMDLRGYGESQQNPEVFVVQDLSEDVHVLIEHLKIDKPITIVGWSLGGAVAQQLVLDHLDKYSRMVLVASVNALGYPEYRLNENGVKVKCNSLEEVIQTPRLQLNQEKITQQDGLFFKNHWVKVCFNSGLVPEDNYLEILTKETLKQTNYPGTVWALNQFDVSNEIHKIGGPVLLYQGTQDLLISPEMTKENAQLIGLDKCKLVIRDHVGHMPPIEDPLDLAQNIVDFIK